MKQPSVRTCLLLIVALLVTALFPITAFADLPEGVPSSLEAPSIQKIALKTYDDGRPYFEAQVYFPQSVLNLDSEAPGGGSVFWEYSVKVDDGSWEEFGGGGYINVYTGGEDGEAPVSAGTFAITFDPIDEGTLTSVDIKSHIYSYQLRVYYDYYEGWPDVQPISSPISNMVTIGSGTYSKTDRLSGASRIGTAIAVSQEGWPNGAGTIILTREDNYPDALTGTPLSKKYDAPILFTNRLTLTPATAAEITRLGVKKVIILGGSGAVSEAIESKLKQNYTVQRIGGTDRYATAAKIAAELGYKGKVVITTGQDFHDALVVAPQAAYQGIPILLTQPNSLPAVIQTALQTIAPTETIVVGNPSAVSNNVLSQLTNARRISGSDIYETAVLVAKNFGANTERVFLATGKDFPDALSGSAVATKFNSPILFVGDPLSAYVKQYLGDNKQNTTTVQLLGGTGAIADTVRNEIEQIYE
ncbi:cell wall-binding repeat-containing protein [Dehalobacter sp. TBBPA1]|uniref:cell wall-binding repeat-containing protein n=1 Tax=Dehalobacter sp. TBBPA1 TaxID=3235037 RepID=UPI0034A5C6EE